MRVYLGVIKLYTQGVKRIGDMNYEQCWAGAKRNRTV